MSLSKIMQKLSLLLLGVAIGVLICEVILRLFYKDRIVLFPRYQTTAQYGDFQIRRNRPGSDYHHTTVEGKWHFVFNSRGFRNSYECDYAKGPNVLRVLSIGDSQTLGYEVGQEETFSAQLSSILQTDSVNNQVINAGVTGFGTAEELIFLENEGVRYKPDYVILGFFQNDYEDNVRSNLFTIKDNALFLQNRKYLPGVTIQEHIYNYWIVRWLSEHSYFYSFAFNTVWNLYKDASLLKASSESDEYAIGTNRKVSDDRIQLALKLLEKMYEVCRKNNAALIVVDIPAWNMDSQVTSSLDDALQSSKTRFYDYLIRSQDIIRNIGAADVHRKQGDHHITPATHKYIAQECAKYIESMLYTERNH